MGKDKKKKEKDKSKKKQKSGKALKKSKEMLLNENVTSQKEADERYEWHDWDDEDDEDEMLVEPEDGQVSPESEEVPDEVGPEPEESLAETNPEPEESLAETNSEPETVQTKADGDSETVQTKADGDSKIVQTKADGDSEIVQTKADGDSEAVQIRADNAPETTQSDTENASGNIEELVEFLGDRRNLVITNGVTPKAGRRKKKTPVEGDTSVPSPGQVQGDTSPVSVEKISDAAVLAVFQALSDENRVKIMNLLAEREMCTSELLEAVNVVQSTMSHHMKVLCDAGLVRMRRQGKRSCYAVRRDTLDQVQAYLEGWKA